MNFDEKDSDNLPKWKPYDNNVRHQEEVTYPVKRKNYRIMIIITVIILAVIAAAVLLSIGLKRREAMNSNLKQDVVSASMEMDDNSIAVMNINEDGKNETSGKEKKGFILTDVSGVVEDVLPSVVSVTSRSLVNYYRGNGRYYDENYGLWSFFFGDSRRGIEEFNETPDQDDENIREVESGIGSGTIIAQNSKELLILTSYHVVEGSSSLYVTFVNEKSVDGYIKSADPERDIAIVALPLDDVDAETKNIIKIAAISSDDVKVGEGVIVIGNALGYGISVTTGIVSAVNRNISVDGKNLSVIQTDAAINSGNSGGCMLNSLGEVIGINEAKVKVSYVEGMCYAIPVSSNLSLIQDLLNAEDQFGVEPENESLPANRVFLGIRGRDVDESVQQMFGNLPQGVYVSNVIPGSGASEAGIIAGDIIVGIDDAVISTMDELQKELSVHETGETVTVVLLREIGDGYQSMTVAVDLTDMIG